MEKDKIHIFNDRFTTDHIRILKIFLGYLDPPMQAPLAVMIRFGELICTIQYLKKTPQVCHPAFSANGFSDLLSEILPYCDDREQDQIRNLQSTFRDIENIRQTMELFEMMQDLMPDFFQGNSESGASQSNPFGFDLSEFSQMMDMMREMNSSQNESKRS